MSNEDGSTTPKGDKMPDNVEAWARLYGLAEKVMRENDSRIDTLESALHETLSKLESQVSRNPDLPLSYRACVNKGFSILRNDGERETKLIAEPTKEKAE